MITMTLVKWHERLSKHDWFYMMSDSADVSINGRAANVHLIAEAEALGGEFLVMYQGFWDHLFGPGSGFPFKSVDEKIRAPKPKRPAV